MLLQRLATGATGVKQARYRRRPTRGSEELVRACAQCNHIKPLRCGHPSIKARGSFPNGGHYRGVPLYRTCILLCVSSMSADLQRIIQSTAPAAEEAVYEVICNDPVS